MTTRNNIENAVCDHFKIEVKDIYDTSKNAYPYGGARCIFMYLLYTTGVKVYDIADLFGKTTMAIYHRLGEVQVALKSDTKIKEDLEKINEKLNSK